MSRLTFSAAAARAAVNAKVPGLVDEEGEEEEPGEEIESAPPLRVGEERAISGSGLRKKLLKAGRGWETPVSGDEVTGQVVPGLDRGLVTMRKGEISLFTVPSALGYGDAGAHGVLPGSDLQYEVELISWLAVVDVCKDGGIMKKILLRGDGGQPGDLDEVAVKYRVRLPDGSVVAETSDGGVEFHINEGHLCPALPKILKTMQKGERAAVTVQPQYAFGEDGRDPENGFPLIPASTILEIDLELVRFKSVLDVMGDMKVVKKVLKEGEGHRRPKDGESVSVRYTGTLQDGTIFEKFGHNGEEPLRFVVDEEQVITGLDCVAATMAKGEVSLVTVQPEYGYGNCEVKGQLSTIPASSTLIYEIEMVDFTKGKEPWELSGHEKIEAAGKLKENGNSLFKIGKYQRAAKRYEKAIEYICDDEPFSSDEQKMSKVLRVSCWLNNAACSLKLKDFQGAVILCSKVLDVESHNVKALFRRAQAYLESSDLDLAELDVKKALEVDPQNRDVKAVHKLLKERWAEKNRNDAKLYADMFSRMRKDTDAALKRLKVEKGAEEGEGTTQAVGAEDAADGGTSSTDGMLVGPSAR